MACKCMNPDGTFAQNCNGTCTQKEFKQSSAIQQRTDENIEDRFEYILGIFLEKVDIRINNLEELSMDKWKEGYKQGYQDGREDY